jgi:hypothetical protein
MESGTITKDYTSSDNLRFLIDWCERNARKQAPYLHIITPFLKIALHMIELRA